MSRAEVLQTVAPPRSRGEVSVDATSKSDETVDPHPQVAAFQAIAEAALTRELQARVRLQELEDRQRKSEALRNDKAMSVRLQELESELELLRTARRSTEVNLLDLRALLDQARRASDDAKATPAFRIGALVLDSLGSWRGILSMPANLMRLRRDLARERTRATSSLVPPEPIPEYQVAAERALAVAEQTGLDAAEQWIRDQRLPASILARALAKLAHGVIETDPSGAVLLLRGAAEANPNEQNIKQLAMSLIDLGSLEEADSLLRSALEQGVVLNGTEKRRADELKALVSLRRNGLLLPPRVAHPRPDQPPRILVVAAQTFPHYWSAVSMRAHGTAQALIADGFAAEVVALPGYPANKAATAADRPEVFDGVRYHRLSPVDVGSGLSRVQNEALGAAFAGLAEQLRATAILAATELGVAYPAAIASRLAGLDLVLDCHSVEAEPHSSADRPALRADLLSHLEVACTHAASGVIARSEIVLRGLVRHGIHASLGAETLPRFEPDGAVPAWRQDPALAGRLVLGFVGDPAPDLDLELFPDLLDELVRRGFDIGFAMFGVGSRFQNIRDRMVGMGHGDRLLYGGRPKPTALAGIFGSIDVAVIPDRPAPGFRAVRYECALALQYNRLIATAPTQANCELLGDRGIYVDGGADEYAEALAPRLAFAEDLRARGSEMPLPAYPSFAGSQLDMRFGRSSSAEHAGPV